MSEPRATRVSVLIVNYRSYPELARCLSSLEQSAAPLDVVVVDQASDSAAAAGITTRFPRVSWIGLENNTGFAAGVNRAARAARSRYLLLLNPDAVMAPDLGAWLPDWLDRHTSVGIAGPRIENEDGTIQGSARRFPSWSTMIAGRSSWLTRALPGNRLSRHNLPGQALTADDAIAVDWVSGACMMVRRDAFDAIGGMDEGFFLYWEDADFCRRAATAGWTTVYHGRVGAVHTGGRSSRHASDASLRAFHRSAFRLFWKHARFPARLLAPVVFVALQIRQAFVRVRANERR